MTKAKLTEKREAEILLTALVYLRANYDELWDAFAVSEDGKVWECREAGESFPAVLQSEIQTAIENIKQRL